MVLNTVKCEDFSMLLLEALLRILRKQISLFLLKLVTKVFLVVFLQILMTVIPEMTYFRRKGKVLGRSLVIVDNMAHVLMVSTHILVSVTQGGMEPSVKLVCQEC